METEPAFPRLSECRAVIPAHCFERSLPRSLSLVFRDLLLISVLLWVSWQLPYEVNTIVEYIPWHVYAFLTGTAFIGPWILAHECGHGAFSDYNMVNDCVGFILHTMLLVPYFSWQFSHSRHHSRTNHLLEGETFVPQTRREWQESGLASMFTSNQTIASFRLTSMLIFGWPMYQLYGASGARILHNGEMSSGVVDHFRPWSGLFPKRMWWKVAISSIGVFTWLSVILTMGVFIGFKRMALIYGAPIMWMNGWLLTYTWLQHTHPEVPHYGKDEWTWMKGALATIDRPYNGVNWIHHNIGSTHVCHHLFPELPQYHAAEATEHLKRFLGPLYRHDDTWIPKALFQTAVKCCFVEDTHGVQYLKEGLTVIKG